ncbi:secretion protein HlyD [Chromobacterium subtsugae]|mgnify:CR=1 FL=1|uniref:Secretion protein HlyD n=1 Tax=Chromobacterium subtsugae TaxID=251747 RepID=A0ABS7FGG6_9NEIS|nr:MULTISPECIES: secretion protein HlyD [Chromobacterium]KUM02704.1 secretion protein HlyD [Chromobacterium subtsugae]KZE84922.1 secretion protein HlyD [Chromobacterium sp. F49]MBW7567864.1 secretion protein HlyD [Chromobacterium subtsugae]MBW8289091.1 secretion protein HlyD [Chromobacterium subtsugae]WSE93765.1 secretion protein HlyD [Chromobacterium subtsugae]
MRKIGVAFAALAVALAASGAGYYAYQRAAGAERNATLYGNVDIRELSLAFRVSGRLAAVQVDEGDSVQPGQILARLDAEPLRNSLNAALANEAALAARNALIHKGNRGEDIAQAKARLEAAAAALTQAQSEYRRQRDLVPAGGSSQQSLEAARSQRDQALAQRDAAAQQWQALARGYRPEEIAESDAQLKQARADLAAARLALRDANLQAPSAGIILTRAVEAGSMVQAGAPAFSLSLRQPVWVRAYVGEAQLGRFPSGGKVLLSTDSHPDKTYHGVVGFVSPTAEFTPKSVETADLRTSLVYRIRIVVSDADAGLNQGMPVTVRLAP